jgi:hypothetical protein
MVDVVYRVRRLQSQKIMGLELNPPGSITNLFSENSITFQGEPHQMKTIKTAMSTNINSLLRKGFRAN